MVLSLVFVYILQSIVLSHLLSSLGSRPRLNLQTIEPLNSCLHSFPLTPSIPRPCKALTQEDGQEAKEVQALTRGTQGGGDVCISGDANKWVHADLPSTWEAYGLQTAPEGYKLNKGAAYYPSEITTKDGNKRIANFVKVKWSNDPIICGKVQGDPAVYFNYLHTIPAGLPQPICTYTANKVALFKESHPLTKEVDNTVEWISDISLKAKLQCWRYKDTRLDVTV